jgi:hypothetical protein
MNHNQVINVTIESYKSWLLHHLNNEREHLNDAFHQNELMNQWKIELETSIYFEEDEEARDDLRLELQNYDSKIWNSAANLYALEDEFLWLETTINEEIERLDGIFQS